MGGALRDELTDQRAQLELQAARGQARQDVRREARGMTAASRKSLVCIASCVDSVEATGSPTRPQVDGGTTTSGQVCS